MTRSRPRPALKTFGNNEKDTSSELPAAGCRWPLAAGRKQAPPTPQLGWAAARAKPQNWPPAERASEQASSQPTSQPADRPTDQLLLCPFTGALLFLRLISAHTHTHTRALDHMDWLQFGARLRLNNRASSWWRARHLNKRSGQVGTVAGGPSGPAAKQGRAARTGALFCLARPLSFGSRPANSFACKCVRRALWFLFTSSIETRRNETTNKQHRRPSGPTRGRADHLPCGAGRGAARRAICSLIRRQS